MRFFFSHFFLAHGLNTAFVSFNFVLTHAQMNLPEYKELREIMDREVRAAFLDPFKDLEEDDAEKHFGPLGRVNFGDQVKLVLPEAMGCGPDGGEDGETENLWYCRLETERSHAGMFVSTHDVRLVDEEDGTEISLSKEFYKKGLENYLGEQIEGNRPARMPEGAMAYDVYDDADEIEESGIEESEAGPLLHKQLWRYMRFTEGKARVLQVLLMVPLAEKDTAPYPKLIAYMNRAVRRAEFPGFDEEGSD